MKKIVLIILSIIVFAGCKKDNNNSGVTGTDGTSGGVTTGNTTNYSGYIVKTIGVSRILIGVDATDNLTVAQLYGGGNKVILKPGAGNTVEMVGLGYYGVLPTGFPPDGGISSMAEPIDNGKLSDTSGISFCIKIKGFDKSKTGYNQLNLVMHDLVRAKRPGTAGFFDNLAWITYDYNKKNADYPGPFFKGLLTGNISVADVEMAAPLSAKPYITEDQVLYDGQAVYTVAQSRTTSVDFSSNTFEFLSSIQDNYNYSLGGPYKYQWVNADNGNVTKYDDYDFTLYFPNIKSGDDVVLPSDTTKDVFLRITGFNPDITGFNQLRLFIAKSGKLYDGGLPFIMSAKQTTTPSLSVAKSIFIADKLFVINAAPVVPHY